jgi:hypothetical protein
LDVHYGYDIAGIEKRPEVDVEPNLMVGKPVDEIDAF